MFKRSWIDREQGQAEGGKALRLSDHEVAFLEEVKAANRIIGCKWREYCERLHRHFGPPGGIYMTATPPKAGAGLYFAFCLFLYLSISLCYLLVKTGLVFQNGFRQMEHSQNGCVRCSTTLGMGQALAAKCHHL